MSQAATPTQTDAEARTTPTPAASDNTNSDIVPLLRCPRCGYDLSGNRADWTDASCALKSVCSECGLRFFWGDLLNENLRLLPWLYEHAGQWFNLRAAWSTAIRALIPWHFWRRVRLHHGVVPRRLMLWPLILFLSIFGPYVLIVAATGALELYLVTKPLPKTLNARSRYLSNPYNFIPSIVSTDLQSVTIGAGDHQATLPIRINSLYEPEFHPNTPLGDVLIIMQGNIGNWQIFYRNIRPTTTVQVDPDRPASDMFPPTATSTVRAISPTGEELQDLVLVMLFPPTRIGYVSWKNAFVGPLLTPFGISIYGFEDNAARFGLGEYAGSTKLAIFFFVGFAVLIIALCPSEWRKAKVRWVHLLRISVVALTPAIFIMLVLFVLYSGNDIAYALQFTGGRMSGSFGYSSSSFLPLWLQYLLSSITSYLTLGVVAFWAPLYFWFALHRGMELRRPILLWIFACLTGWLGAITLLLFINVFLFADML